MESLHPFEWLSATAQKRVFVVLLMVTLAFWCAIPKFFIVAVGLIYIAVSALLLMIRKPGT
jgi:hypothetical protein